MRNILRLRLGLCQSSGHSEARRLLEWVEELVPLVLAQRYRDVAKAWIMMIGQLRLVLYHRGRVREAPRKIMPSTNVRSAQPAIGVLVEKWLKRRAAALRPPTVYHLALASRSFLGHPAEAAPEVQTFAAARHEHVISWMNAMATELSTKTGGRSTRARSAGGSSV